MPDESTATRHPDGWHRFAPLGMAVAVSLIVGFVAWMEFQRVRQTPRVDRSSPPQDQPAGLKSLIPAQQLRQEGQLDAALDSVDAILSENMHHIEAYLLRAELLYQLHRADEMIPSLEAARAMAPERFEIHANLAFALRYAGRLDDAERETQWCLQRDPNHVPVRRIAAEIQRDRGDSDGALQSVGRILEHAPDDIETRLLEAELLLFQRQSETAYQRLKPLIDHQEHNPRFLMTLSRAAQAMGHTEEATRYRAAAQAIMRD